MKNMYVKKPVIIEAHQILGEDSALAIEDWINDNKQWNVTLDANAYEHSGRWCIEIETLEGVMTASHGDYVIRGVQGEFYPCKPDIFEQTYEKMTP